VEGFERPHLPTFAVAASRHGAGKEREISQPA
jgi:hypothetical protein